MDSGEHQNHKHTWSIQYMWPFMGNQMTFEIYIKRIQNLLCMTQRSSPKFILSLKLNIKPIMAEISRPSFSLVQFPSSFTHDQSSFNVVYNIPTTNYFQPQQLIVPNSPHPIVTFVIPVILNLIELKCQCRGNSPFDTNPITMWFSVAFLLAYSLAYGIELRFSSRLRSANYPDHMTIRRTSSLFGSLCLASLTSILLPKMKPLLYSFYVLLSIGDVLQSYGNIKIVWKWIEEKIVGKFLHPCEGQQVERNRLPV